MGGIKRRMQELPNWRGQRAADGPESARPALDALDDARLVALVADKDLRAFEALYRRHHQRLTRFLSNMLRRPQLVEEVLNDTMMVVWNRADSYNGASKVTTWVFAIAYRKALRALKRADEPMEDHQAQTRRTLDPDPEQRMGQRQVQQALMGALGALTADHRAVVDLTYFHEMGYREIAEIVGCPIDTVKTRMFHARRRLKAILAGQLTDWL
jgi:RNA polymerase sigma-70 factor (ECF subfamily)